MVLLNPAVTGLLLPPDCEKLRGAASNDVSLGMEFAKTSARSMKKPGRAVCCA